MFNKALFLSILIFFGSLLSLSTALACESCTLSRLGEQRNIEGRWSVEYLFEQQAYVEKDAHEAHTLHHQGHDFHNKSTDNTHHTIMGYRFNDRWSLTVDFPYVVRRSIEVDSHAHLGEPVGAQGLGDIPLTVYYNIVLQKDQDISLFSGVKFPSGSTKELTSFGSQFEPELQLGSGSFDYLWGGVYQGRQGSWGTLFNVVYIAKTPGAAEFELGDVFSTTAGIDYYIVLPKPIVTIAPGLRINYQYEDRHRQHGTASPDSGGRTLLAGPALTIKGDNVAVFGSYLGPVEQNLGGVHQHLAYAWTLGAQVKW